MRYLLTIVIYLEYVINFLFGLLFSCLYLLPSCLLKLLIPILYPVLSHTELVADINFNLFNQLISQR